MATQTNITQADIQKITPAYIVGFLTIIQGTLTTILQIQGTLALWIIGISIVIVIACIAILIWHFEIYRKHYVNHKNLAILSISSAVLLLFFLTSFITLGIFLGIFQLLIGAWIFISPYLVESKIYLRFKLQGSDPTNSDTCDPNGCQDFFSVVDFNSKLLVDLYGGSPAKKAIYDSGDFATLKNNHPGLKNLVAPEFTTANLIIHFVKNKIIWEMPYFDGTPQISVFLGELGKHLDQNQQNYWIPYNP